MQAKPPTSSAAGSPTYRQSPAILFFSYGIDRSVILFPTIASRSFFMSTQSCRGMQCSDVLHVRLRLQLLGIFVCGQGLKEGRKLSAVRSWLPMHDALDKPFDIITKESLRHTCLSSSGLNLHLQPNSALITSLPGCHSTKVDHQPKN